MSDFEFSFVKKVPGVCMLRLLPVRGKDTQSQPAMEQPPDRTSKMDVRWYLRYDQVDSRGSGMGSAGVGGDHGHGWCKEGDDLVE